MKKLFATVCAIYLASSALQGETRHISPDHYYTTFSAAHPPVARVHPGDTVVTKCLVEPSAG